MGFSGGSPEWLPISPHGGVVTGRQRSAWSWAERCSLATCGEHRPCGSLTTRLPLTEALVRSALGDRRGESSLRVINPRLDDILLLFSGATSARVRKWP